MKYILFSISVFFFTLSANSQNAEKITHPRNLHSDTWVATDALNRVLPGYKECGPLKKDRYVGIFYFITHISHGGEGPNNATEILKANTDKYVWKPGSYYWAEPELGYYLNYDKWVIRRHAMQLSDAGVDVIIFDVTNDRTYPEVYLPVCEVYRKMRAEGEKTPDIAFLGSEISILRLWEDFYKKRMYNDLWFYWKGKPLLLFGQHEIPSRKKMNDVVFPDSIRDFFSIRQSWAWTSLPWYDNGKDEWPWVDHYPQAIAWHDSANQHEMVPVAVAQHPLSNIGRSFHNFRQPDNDKYDLTPYTDQGLCFEEQWSRALEVDPEFVFVTGWNEWTAGIQIMGKDIKKELMQWKFYPGAQLGFAGREIHPGDGYFIDQYNQEYSRDIEPMKGGHTDNYYYQLIANVRKYKGVSKPVEPGKEVSIDIFGGFDQWKSINAVYYDHTGDTEHRNCLGEAMAGPYVNYTGRNDILESKVARDKKNVYIYVKTKNALTPWTDPHWMLLFLDIDQNKETGWKGYDYIVNSKIFSDSVTSIRTIHNKRLGKPIRIRYRHEGNQLMIEIPRTLIHEKELSFDFHWADNIQKFFDLNEFFTNGDNAPERRFNYRFVE